MKPIFLATVAGVLLAASSCARAAQSARTPDPLDPGAPVPALSYDSALRGHARANADATTTPDKTWRRANDTVAGKAGEGQHEHGDGHGSAAAPPAPPAPAPAHSHHHPAPGKQ